MNYIATTLTITSGQTESPEVTLNSYGERYVRRVAVQSPSTLPETVTMSVSIDGSAFATLQSGGSDITFPASKVTQINGFMVTKLKLVAGAAVGANRAFLISIAAE